MSPGCSARCFFCDPPRAGTLPAGDIKRQEVNILKNLLEFKKQGIRMVEISGCDPLEYHRIAELMAYIRKSFDWLQLSTHGLQLADKPLRQKILASGVTKFRIPVYGSEAAIHDKIIGLPGAFAKTVRGVRAVMREAPDVIMQISTLVTGDNKEDLKSIIKMVGGWGVEDFYISVPAMYDTAGREYLPLKEACAYLTEANNYAKRLKCPVWYYDIPPCVAGEDSPRINNTSLPPNLGKNCQPQGQARSGIKDLPKYRLKKKFPMCRKCTANDHCHGFFAADVDVHGIGDIKPIK